MAIGKDPFEGLSESLKEAKGYAIDPFEQAEAVPTEALQEAGYFTEGFQGKTLGEYRSWYSEAFGVDPIQTSFEIGGGKGAAGAKRGETTEDFLRRVPSGFTTQGEFVGATPTTARGIAALDVAQQRFGRRETERAEAQGMAMMSWLMGQAQELSGTQFSQLAGVGMPQAQMAFGMGGGGVDYSGVMGAMVGEERQALAAQEAKRARQAAKFDFTRDLLPSLITLGGTIAGGALAGGGGAAAGGQAANQFGGYGSGAYGPGY